MNKSIITGLLLFAVAGCTLGLVDLRDHVTIGPTNGVPAQPTDERLAITDAKREATAYVDGAIAWGKIRQEDIQKREQWIVFAEQFFSGGTETLLGAAGQIAGPWAPLLTYLAGAARRRRGDVDPETFRKGKEESYKAGQRATKALLDAAGVKPEPTNS